MKRSKSKGLKGKSMASGRKLVSLTAQQIDKLCQNGNYSPDWKKIKVSTDFNADQIWHSCFFGNVSLGRHSKKASLDGVELECGIYHSKIVNSHIGDEVLMSDVRLLSNYVVKNNAVLFNNGMITASKDSSFGNGVEIPIAIETGGREVKLYAEMNVVEASKIASSRDNKKLLSAYEKKVEKFTKEASLGFGVIEEGAQVKNNPRIEDVYIGPYAIVDNCLLVKNTTILSNKDEKAEVIDGAYVRNSIIQWGSEVASGAIVDESCLTEHSHVERHGKVTQSILGPNTGVAEGEVTASLVGPFVGFHHQSLLIAAFWPEGKGNVGYGANVGSNHTSKAPDQEIWPGEGCFFGLGTNIKFPSDFTKAPYMIIASGVSALPQKVTFPFSLVNSPAATLAGVSPAYNEIMPGWVLSDNIFTIKRNEGKYKKRNKAKRSKFIFEVFRPDIVDLMIDARNRLLSIKAKKKIYTSRDIRGLGKNYLLEPSRKKGIEAYNFYIKYYALLGLKCKLEEKGSNKKALAKLLDTPSKDSRWEHERRLILEEVKEKDFAKNLSTLLEMEEKIANDVQISKEKDDQRGAKVIEDYPHAHPPASQDSFVKQTWDNLEETKKEVGKLIRKI